MTGPNISRVSAKSLQKRVERTARKRYVRSIMGSAGLALLIGISLLES
jgi:hypothetical protein